jgi:hypothetical protein
VTYDGCGHSGQIESVEYFDAGGKSIEFMPLKERGDTLASVSDICTPFAFGLPANVMGELAAIATRHRRSATRAL